jgi:acetyl-CoA carboxylase carboxyltransferase component
MAFEKELKELDKRRRHALAMGGAGKLAKRRNQGLMNARERIDYLLDKGSFVESGLFGTSAVVPEDRDTTPADGKVAGFGRIDGRDVAIVSNDFTVKGASSSLTNMKKIGHIKRAATESGLPIVFLGESSGARMPDNMGSKGMGALLGNDPHQYRRQRETPWVSAVLGPCFGSSAWYACLADFNVMRKGAILAVASPQLASLAIGEEVDPEELGGWQLHDEITGLADMIAETDEEALDRVREFLSYLPSHHNAPPPEKPVPPGSDEAALKVLDHLPENRTRVYEVRRIVRALLDKDSFFELKARFGRAAVTGLGRLDGKTVGVIANNPIVKGGALDASACEKVTRFIVLCDSFNIPILILVDTPGFLIGKEGERQKAPGKIMNFMSALQLVTVPKISVIMRKSYGQAYLNMGGGRNSDEVVAWPTAEVSFMDPEYGARVVAHARPAADDPKQIEEIKKNLARDSSVWDMASLYAVQAVIDPAETRAWLIRMFNVHRRRLTGGIGRHLMGNWPSTY